ncbi:hypothetical protein AFLA_007198 [Aspergillus flavus NRRL3357]|nr:hypothetical protein AFLA_007198 [Aspergillus flavus NRRL3357]
MRASTVISYVDMHPEYSQELNFDANGVVLHLQSEAPSASDSPFLRTPLRLFAVLSRFQPPEDPSLSFKTSPPPAEAYSASCTVPLGTCRGLTQFHRA